MANPQQPELARSRKTPALDPDASESVLSAAEAPSRRPAPRAGARGQPARPPPAVEQDKPDADRFIAKVEGGGGRGGRRRRRRRGRPLGGGHRPRPARGGGPDAARPAAGLPCSARSGAAHSAAADGLAAWPAHPGSRPQASCSACGTGSRRGSDPRRASQRPRWPGTTSKATGVAHVDRAGAVGDRRCSGRRARAPSSAVDGRRCRVLVELDDPAPLGHQWTILDSGSSMMSVAPASFSAGISVLISALGTTVSTA